MDPKTRGVLAAHAGYAFADNVIGGTVVEDEWQFWERFGEARAAGVVEPRVAKLHRRYVDEATSVRPLREWRREFRRVGFRATWGDLTVLREPPDNFLVWRLGQDWRTSLSWTTDARFCHSVPVIDGVTDVATLWAAVVPADALLGVAWYGKAGLRTGRPMWRTVEHETMGTVTLAVDDFAEAFVDPTKLTEGDALRPGCVVSAREFTGGVSGPSVQATWAAMILGSVNR